MKFDFKKLIPHAIAIAVFFLIALVYCKPAFEGKVLNAHDNIGWKGMAQQSFEQKEKLGQFPKWTNSMFGGMPTYQIALEGTHKISFNYVSYILTLGLPKPANFFFLACLCFYLLALVLGINPWIGIMGAVSYAYSTYDPIIIGAGHDTKMLAIGYAPLVIAGLLLLFNKRWWIGSAALATGFVLQVSTNHLQIVYYTLLILGAITIGFFIVSFKKKELAAAFKSIAIAAIIGIIALGSNAIGTLTTWEYSKESMRGGISELKETTDKNTTSGGLDKDYAFKYSVGITETFTMLVPGMFGGSNGGNEYKTSKFADKLIEIGQPEDSALQYANGISYWGKQQPTSGPVYFGAVIMLLFLFAMFYEKGWLKWSLFGAGMFGIILAWGNNLESVNYFLFDYLPLYKKFRAPSMGLVMPQLCFVVLATVALNNLLSATAEAAAVKKALKQTAIGAAVIVALLGFLYISFDYTSPNDKGVKENMTGAMLQQYAQQGQQPGAEVQQQAESFGKAFITAIQEDRKSLFAGDLIRSFIFISLTLLVLWFASTKKLQAVPAMIILLLLSSIDLLSVGKRYLNENNFVDGSDFDNAFAMTDADRQIKQDKGYFRVFNTTVDFVNESVTAYHHNSIGGYHPAKLQIYQDLIENQIVKNNMQVLNMLNTKYFIVQNPQTGAPFAQMNPSAFGPVWLVKGIKYVSNGKEEMKALDSTNLRDTAVVQVKFKSVVGADPVYDSTASIQLIENKNDLINYESKANSNQFAVFSEVYYNKGWNAFIDGKKAEIVKTNYALRGLAIPAGNHQIEFRFEPQSYKTGDTIVLISALLTYLIVIAGLFMEWKKSKQA